MKNEIENTKNVGFIPNPDQPQLSPAQKLIRMYRRWRVRQKLGMTRKCAMILVDVRFVIEHWRNGVLLDREVKAHDLVVNSGLNLLCDVVGDLGGQEAALGWTAIGTDGTAPAAAQTALLAEVMRVSNSYSKDGPVGEASLDAVFNIVATYALLECGLLNAAAAGIMYCRDIYTVKNVESGDTVNVNYTITFTAV